MRNFRREELTGAMLEKRFPAPEFSWSLSRHLLFRKCPFAYFIRYYLTQGGWDSFADSPIRMAYLEKHAILFDTWLSRILQESAARALETTRFIGMKNRSTVFERYFSARMDSMLESGLNAFEKKKFLDDPKSVHFCDTEEKSTEELREAGLKKLRDSAHFLLESDTFRILSMQFGRERVSASFPMKSVYGGFRIHTEPGINWLEPGALCVLKLSVVKRDENILQMAADVFSLCVLLQWKRHDALCIFQDAGHEICISGESSRAENTIENDCAQMLSFEHSGTVTCMDFERREKPENCGKCLFKTTCSALFEQGI